MYTGAHGVQKRTSDPWSWSAHVCALGTDKDLCRAGRVLTPAPSLQFPKLLFNTDNVTTDLPFHPTYAQDIKLPVYH